LSFKRSAVELWLSGGKSAEAVAAELGISGQTLKTWKQQLAVPPPPSTAQSLEQFQEENRRRRRELTDAQRRRDILKNLGHPCLMRSAVAHKSGTRPAHQFVTNGMPLPRQTNSGLIFRDIAGRVAAMTECEQDVAK
jgi:transposase-like protein